MTDTDITRYEQLVTDICAFYNGDFSKKEVFAESIKVVNPLAELHGRDE